MEQDHFKESCSCFTKHSDVCSFTTSSKEVIEVEIGFQEFTIGYRVKLKEKGGSDWSRGNGVSSNFQRFKEDFIVWASNLKNLSPFLGRSQIFILQLGNQISMDIFLSPWVRRKTMRKNRIEKLRNGKNQPPPGFLNLHKSDSRSQNSAASFWANWVEKNPVKAPHQLALLLQWRWLIFWSSESKKCLSSSEVSVNEARWSRHWQAANGTRSCVYTPNLLQAKLTIDEFFDPQLKSKERKFKKRKSNQNCIQRRYNDSLCQPTSKNDQKCSFDGSIRKQNG